MMRGAWIISTVYVCHKRGRRGGGKESEPLIEIWLASVRSIAFESCFIGLLLLLLFFSAITLVGGGIVGEANSWATNSQSRCISFSNKLPATNILLVKKRRIRVVLAIFVTCDDKSGCGGGGSFKKVVRVYKYGIGIPWLDWLSFFGCVCVCNSWLVYASLLKGYQEIGLDSSLTVDSITVLEFFFFEIAGCQQALLLSYESLPQWE